MEVDVEVQRGAEALDKGDRPGLGAGGDGESRLLNEVCGDRSIRHAQDLTQYLGLGGKQEKQPDGSPYEAYLQNRSITVGLRYAFGGER